MHTLIFLPRFFFIPGSHPELPGNAVGLGIESSTIRAVIPLEDRRMLSTFLVTTLDDDGAGSLSAAVEQAVSQPEEDTIAFDPSLTGTIGLTRTLPELTSDLTITGLGSALLTLERDTVNLFSLFTISPTATVSISGITMANGEAVFGGGIHNEGHLTLTDTRLENNEAHFRGGGVWNAGTLDIVDSTFIDNVGDDSGGAIENTGGRVQVHRSTFVRNRVHDDWLLEGTGGAIHNDDGVILVWNSTFSANRADYRGAAIASSSGQLDIGWSTFTENRLGRPDGEGASVFFTEGTISFGMSIFADPNSIHVPISGSHSLYNHGHNVFIDGSSYANETSLSNTDPMLQPLGDNGGPTWTHALRACSPARDRGDPTFAPSTDQRGNSRHQGSGPDIGAFELSPADLGILVTTLTDDNDPLNSATSLREAIANATTLACPQAVTFAEGLEGTILLNSALPGLRGELALQGPGAEVISVARRDGPLEYRIFTVAPESKIEISGISITNGIAEYGGGIFNEGTLTLRDVVLNENLADESGGGVANDGGDLTILDSLLSENAAQALRRGHREYGRQRYGDTFYASAQRRKPGGLCARWRRGHLELQRYRGDRWGVDAKRQPSATRWQAEC